MTTVKEDLSVAALKRAIENRDGPALAAFYRDDAEIRIIDHEHPPKAPRVLAGKAAISAYYDDACGRAMTHHVDEGVSDGQHLAFTETCAYPDGTQVICAAMIELEGGRIKRQTSVQAWDS